MNSSVFVGFHSVLRAQVFGALLAGACLAGNAAFAGDGAQAKETAQVEKTVVLTGSHIPKKVKPGRHPATAANLVIIDRQEIERTGATSLMGVLNRTGNSR